MIELVKALRFSYALVGGRGTGSLEGLGSMSINCLEDETPLPAFLMSGRQVDCAEDGTCVTEDADLENLPISFCVSIEIANGVFHRGCNSRLYGVFSFVSLMPC